MVGSSSVDVGDCSDAVSRATPSAFAPLSFDPQRLFPVDDDTKRWRIVAVLMFVFFVVLATRWGLWRGVRIFEPTVPSNF